MTRLRLSGAARADLLDIRHYGVENFGATVADRRFRRFNEVFRLLRDHPQAGSAHPELGDGVRCVTRRPHRIFYRITDVGVKVLRIVHHARDLSEAALGDPRG